MRRDLPPQAATAPAIDHDHRCCGDRRHCARCVRGLAHNSCNKLIGFAGENPDLLERIAASLRTAAADAARRTGDGQLPLSA